MSERSAQLNEKSCPDCKVSKPTSGFGVNASMRDGLSFYCLDCNRRRNQAHYRKSREAAGKTVRTPDRSPDGWKRCAECLETKPVSEFHAHKKERDGLVGYCKACRKVQNRRVHLRRSYGLDELSLAEMVDGQGGLCAICRARPAVHVDHDHRTQHVRGVLCFRCNVALGQLNDDTSLMRNAIDYLERTGTPQCQRTLVSAGVYRLTTPRSAAAVSRSFSLPPRPISSRPA